jgi:hypothetical protein
MAYKSNMQLNFRRIFCEYGYLRDIQSGQETDGGTSNHHVYSSVIRGPIAYFWQIFKLSGNAFSRSRAAISVNKVLLKVSHTGCIKKSEQL